VVHVLYVAEKMKPSLTSLLIVAVLLCVMIAGMWFAHRKGIDEGMKAGAWQANVNSIAAILSSRALEEQGDLPMARKQIDDFLYFSASSLDLNQDSSVLEEYNRSAGEQLLMQVAEYYWNNPDSYNINSELDTNTPNDALTSAVMEAMEPILEVVRDHHNRTVSILNRYKPEAEQAASSNH
jgi:hypothetical protein